MSENIRKSYAIQSKYLTKNGEIETLYKCSVCNMGLSKDQKVCKGCYRIVIWE